MKFLVFADFHYAPGVLSGESQEKMEAILNRAEQEQVDFIIHAGDLCHDVSQYGAFVERYNDFSIPTYHCLGNHDCDNQPLPEVLKAYRMKQNYYFFDQGGYRIIVCDPNYFIDTDGAYVHYEHYNDFGRGKARDYMPPEQLHWLAETIDASMYPCILISHESFEREADGCRSGLAVRELIRKANQKRPHSVILCINGHYHTDNLRLIDNVCYLDLNSASYCYLSDTQTHNVYPPEVYEQIRFARNMLLYNEPLSAVITIEGCDIDINGMEGTLFMGVNREMAGYPKCDACGRTTTASIQSAHLTLR